MAYRNFYNFHRITFKKHICKLDKNLKKNHFYHFSKIAAVLEIFDFDICLLLHLEISLLYSHIDFSNTHLTASEIGR